MGIEDLQWDGWEKIRWTKYNTSAVRQVITPIQTVRVIEEVRCILGMEWKSIEISISDCEFYDKYHTVGNEWLARELGAYSGIVVPSRSYECEECGAGAAINLDLNKDAPGEALVKSCFTNALGERVIDGRKLVLVQLTLPGFDSIPRGSLATYTTAKQKGEYNLTVGVEDVPGSLEFKASYTAADEDCINKVAFDYFNKVILALDKTVHQ